MNLETYKQRMAEFGISRGALTDGQRMPVDPMSVIASHRAEPTKWHSVPGKLSVPPEFLYDCSHLNPRNSKREQEKFSKLNKGRTPPNRIQD